LPRPAGRTARWAATGYVSCAARRRAGACKRCSSASRARPWSARAVTCTTTSRCWPCACRCSRRPSDSIGSAVAVSEHLSVDLRHEADMVVVRLDGELDLASAPLLESEMERPAVGAAARVVLDLRELQFIDSTGLRTIFIAQARSREREHEFAVTRGPAHVQRLLSLTLLAEHL